MTLVALGTAEVVVWGYGSVTAGWSLTGMLLWMSNGLVVTAIALGVKRQTAQQHSVVLILFPITVEYMLFINPIGKTKSPPGAVPRGDHQWR